MDKVIDREAQQAPLSGKKAGAVYKGREAPEAQKIRIDDRLLGSRGCIVRSKHKQRLALEYRGIKRRLLRRLGFISRKKDAMENRNLLLVTSTRPGEGKTFTAVNLALSLMLEDRVGVVLIDADAHRPRVLQQLGVMRRTGGITDILSSDGRITLDDCLLHAHDRPLSILPAGSRAESATELMTSIDAQVLIREVGLRYPDRVIIVDLPPILATSDAIAMAAIADEVMFVVEAHKTPEVGVATALDELLEVTTNVSLVLNQCLVRGQTAQYYSYEEYYSRKGGRNG